MLDTIKEELNNLDDVPFKDFYQDYIVGIQQNIMTNDMRKANYTFNSIDDVSYIIKGLNKLVEGLKSW